MVEAQSPQGLRDDRKRRTLDQRCPTPSGRCDRRGNGGAERPEMALGGKQKRQEKESCSQESKTEMQKKKDKKGEGTSVGLFFVAASYQSEEHTSNLQSRQ